MTTWADVYRMNASATASLAPELDRNADLEVPATPLWRVRELVAHLAGAPSDAVSGRMDGAPSPTWTSRHVAERSTLGVDELLAEIDSNLDAVAASVSGTDRPALVWDAAVHHADLVEALGLRQPDPSLWRPVLDAVRPRLGDRAETLASVDGYELFRGIFSRRSRRQMADWGTALSPDALADITIFGPRDDDQPRPLA